MCPGKSPASTRGGMQGQNLHADFRKIQRLFGLHKQCCTLPLRSAMSNKLNFLHRLLQLRQSFSPALKAGMHPSDRRSPFDGSQFLLREDSEQWPEANTGARNRRLPMFATVLTIAPMPGQGCPVGI